MASVQGADEERLNRLMVAVMEVYGFVPLSVRQEAARAAMAVAERYFATPLPTTQSHNDGSGCGPVGSTAPADPSPDV